MLKFIWLLLNIFLILLILIRMPNNESLDNFATKSQLLGSPNSAQQFLNNLTLILIISYFILAIKFNFSF